MEPDMDTGTDIADKRELGMERAEKLRHRLLSL